jgi:hypothetical protein
LPCPSTNQEHERAAVDLGVSIFPLPALPPFHWTCVQWAGKSLLTSTSCLFFIQKFAHYSPVAVYRSNATHKLGAAEYLLAVALFLQA